MTLSLFNTLARGKQAFTPQDPNRVTMYVCGPTVYDRVHVGNARPVVVFDVLFRLLAHHYGEVVYARNITDIDDKILRAAAVSGQPFLSLARHFEARFVEDMTALNARPPTLMPRATDHIDAMIGMIERLLEREHAYVVEGHVLFHVPSDPGYGRLSGIDRDGMLEGARVEVAPFKRDPADFVLWKPSTDDQPGWPSPWGFGRPGWHIECSAMVETNLGTTIDIHGGGRDLVFPHHENEIAQSQGAHDGAPLARYWVHNGMVTVGGEKMAKSRGNFTTVASLLERYPGEVIRYALLGGHYRQSLDVSDAALNAAWKSLDRLYRGLREVEASLDLDRNQDRNQDSDPNRDVDSEMDSTAREAQGVGDAKSACDAAVIEALDDDLNTPRALARLHDMLRELNQLGERGGAAEPVADSAAARQALARRLRASARLLGLLEQDAGAWFQSRGEVAAADADAIEALIAARAEARATGDYARADALRHQLGELGVEIEDRADGTTQWHVSNGAASTGAASPSLSDAPTSSPEKPTREEPNDA